MGEVDLWLSGLGLGRYSRLFSEHEIDARALRELTDADLRELGLPIGHRKRILRGLRTLEDGATTAARELEAERPAGGTAAQPAASADGREAERRHLTIIFIDLVGSTELTLGLDPEDLAALLNTFHDTCVRLVRRYGGYVARYLGDGLTAYFGWPEAHENDAERACLTGLDLISAIKSIPTGASERLQIHVGIASGDVVVGDVLDIRNKSRRSVYEVYGDTPNLAARLQSITPADAIFVSEATYGLIKHKFACTSLGRRKLKGFAAPIYVYRIDGVRLLSSSFDARTAAGLTPVVGRSEEVNLLRSRLQQASAGDGQVVLLAGDPGIGKSRLCAELRAAMGAERLTSLSFQCSPLHTDSPLHPLTTPIAQLAAFADGDLNEAKWEKLDKLFDDVGEDRSDGVALLATHLGIRAANLLEDATRSPERRRMAVHRLLSDFIIHLAARAPVLLIVEDVHWADPTTREFLDILINRVHGHAILLILTFRSEFAAPWGARDNQTALTLNRLTQAQSALMVDAVAKAAKLPRHVVTEIVDRSDGNPLFIEELTTAMLGAGELHTVPRYAGTSAQARIPPTLQDSLLARIDRTSSEAKELLQICAVVGRRFSYAQIRVVAGVGEAEPSEALAALTKDGLLQSLGRPPEAEYWFKHALIQDAAYSLILREKRQRLHSRYAVALEENFQSICAREPGVPARHHEEASNNVAAVPYYLAAGRSALERSSLKEATAYLQRGLALLGGTGKTPWRENEELQLRSTLGRVFIFSRGWAHPSVKREYGRALELCAALALNKQRVPLEWAIATYHLLRGEIREAVSGGGRVLALAEREADEALLSVAHSACTIYRFYDGDFAGSIRHKDEALRFYRPQVGAELQKQFGTDRKLQALRGASLSHWCLGDHQAALDLDEEHRSLAQANGRPFEYAYALTISCILHSLRRDPGRTLAFAEAAIAVAEDGGFSFLEANARNFRALALAIEAPGEATLEHCRATIESYQAAGNRMGISAMLAIMAELHGRIGGTRVGLEYAESALRYVRRSGERFAASDLHRVKGELLARTGALPEARRSLIHAVQIARRQQARTWEIAAAIPLAEVLLRRSEFGPARKLLQPLSDGLRGAPQFSARLAEVNALLRLDGEEPQPWPPNPHASQEFASPDGRHSQR